MATPSLMAPVIGWRGITVAESDKKTFVKCSAEEERIPVTLVLRSGESSTPYTASSILVSILVILRPIDS